MLSAAEFTAGTVATTSTASDGTYSVATLTPGNYIVCEVLQAGWIQSFPVALTTDSADCSAGTGLGGRGWKVSLGSAGTDSGNDFGNYRNATKSGTKFEDSNANGTKDTGEPGVGGVTIRAYADANGDGLTTTGETFVSTTTDASGNYSFTLTPGKYVVCEVLQAGWIQSFPAGDDECTLTGLGADGWAITLTSNQTDSGNDFGNYRNATKTGTKFNDLNNNGTKDTGEPGLSGWTIRAYADANGDGLTTTGETFVSTTTDTSGNYSFTLRPGNYVVCEVLQAGWTQTFPTGTDECTLTGLGADGWAITLTSNQTDSGNDFGNQRLFRLIVITCSEVTGALIVSTVDLDGNPATTTDILDTISANPTGVTGNLCNLGGAQYNNLPANTYTPSVLLPKAQ